MMAGSLPISSCSLGLLLLSSVSFFWRGSGGLEVTASGSGIDVNEVVQSLPAADVPILLLVRPFRNSTSNGIIDDGSDSSVVGVLEAQGSRIFGGSLGVVGGIFVSASYR